MKKKKTSIFVKKTNTHTYIFRKTWIKLLTLIPLVVRFLVTLHFLFFTYYIQLFLCEYFTYMISGITQAFMFSVMTLA